MGSASRSLRISPKSPLHQQLKDRLSSRIELAKRGSRDRYDRWRVAEELTLAFMPETDADAVRRNRRESGNPAYTTIVLPYTYAVLMSAHTYWTSVFFARSPIHQYAGRHGEGEQQTQAVEALINYQVEVGQFLGPYYIWLYDAGKYGVGWLGQFWDVEKIHYGQVVEMEGQFYQATQEVEGYRGNKVYNVSPYDALPDPRVPVNRFQDGEFFCVRKRLGWNQVLRRVDQGYFINTENLKEHAGRDESETEGSSELTRPQFNLEMTGYDERGNKEKHPAGIVFWEVYIELVPNEWGLGNSKFPQKWCFSITQDKDLIIGASPLGYIHGRFPFDVLEMEVEGYGMWNRGVADILQPLQNTMDWLLNTHMYNVRASMNNQFILDPSKIVVKDAAKAGPGFVWRLRPEAYGTDISKMFMQVPVNDVTRGHLADLQIVSGFSERAIGVNDQIMGALNNNNRKTATEVRTTTGFGVNRMKTITEYMSSTGFSPHSQKLVQTSQQLYDVQAKLRRVGSLIEDAGQAFINVSPEDIAGFYNFVPVDGTLPVDRMAQANLWKELLASIRQMPEIGGRYDIGRMFGWVAVLAGLKNINQFRIQVQPNAQVQQQAQAGNVVPLNRPPGVQAVQPGNSASTQTGLNALQGGSAIG